MILIEITPRKSSFTLIDVDSLASFNDLLLCINDEDCAEDEKSKDAR
jgi:hypothetical protein